MKMRQWKIGLRKRWPNKRKRQRAEKKIRAQGGDATDDVSGITPSILSTSELLSSTLSARLGEFNAIEERKAKIKEKESERKSALELIQCAIQFGTESQKQMGTQLLTQKLEMLKQKLDDEQMKQDLDSLGIGEQV
jgi:hypothetical protein